MNKFSIIAAIAMSLVGSSAVAEEYSSITVATEGAFAPWNLKDSTGALIGFEIELLPDLCERMGIECELVEQAWGGIIPGLQNGKFDAIMAAMSITEERKKAVLFTDPYASVGTTLVTLRSNPMSDFEPEIDHLSLQEIDSGEQAVLDAIAQALEGKVLAVNRATTNEGFAKAFLNREGIEVRTYDNAENLALDLVSGRADAAVVTQTQHQLLANAEHTADVVRFGPVMTGGLLGSGTGVAVRKSDEELAAMFSEAINAAIADGTISRLTEKWFGFDAAPR